VWVSSLSVCLLSACCVFLVDTFFVEGIERKADRPEQDTYLPTYLPTHSKLFSSATPFSSSLYLATHPFFQPFFSSPQTLSSHTIPRMAQRTTSPPPPPDIESEQLTSLLRQNRDASAANIVDWDADDDPVNPQNWSNRKKWLNILSISSMSFSVYISHSIFLFPIFSLTYDSNSNFNFQESFANRGVLDMTEDPSPPPSTPPGCSTPLQNSTPTPPSCKPSPSPSWSSASPPVRSSLPHSPRYTAANPSTSSPTSSSSPSRSVAEPLIPSRHLSSCASSRVWAVPRPRC